MGISNKSNGRKSDKETQSPMLKIFKDIMQKDIIDAEKVTLLKDKKKDKKKKSYSESRSKSDQRSYDSSSTDRYKTNKQANITVQDILKDREDYGFDRSRNDGFRGGVKESWWFWKDFKKKQETKRGRNRTDDTCSCVSCALKKIISSECTCVAVLVLLFSVSVVMAFLFIFRGDSTYDMKQLIKRQLPESYGTERNKWDRQLNSLGSVSDILDNTGNNYERSYLNDVNAEPSGDLASVLDNHKIDSHTSEKLRDFFEKLVQTDVKIKKLKNDINHYYQNDNLNSFTERFKRSLKNHFNNHNSRAINKRKRRPKNFKRIVLKDKKRSINQFSRYNVTGYIIENEKVLVEYEPWRKRNFPKCSHSHETKSHEKKLKHPFYKHSQRIDEMLNYKKPEVVTKNLLLKEKIKPKPKTKSNSSTPTTNKMKLIDYKVYDEKQEVHTKTVKEHTKMKTKPQEETSFDLETFLSTTPLYDIALSVTTLINPWESNSKAPNIPTNDRIGYRKLMEADEDDNEELNYDLREVLSDDDQERDHIDKPLDIKKRDSNEQFDLNQYKYFPSQILNPNWKGPMPFYPDEINAMIKHAALRNFNFQLPVTSKDMKAEGDKIKKDVSDTEYIEDYADQKFNKIVKMAQAYSDYGVVYNKKDEDSKEKIMKPENRFKQSLEKDSLKREFFSKPCCGLPSEGIRIEYRKGSGTTEHDQLIKDISKHIKIVKHPMHESHSTTLQPINIDFEKLYSSKHFSLPVDAMDTKKSTKSNKNKVFVIRKGSRSLKSIDITYELRENNSSAGFNETRNHNATNIDSVFSFLSLMGDWFRTLSNLSGEQDGFVGNSISNNTQVNSTKSMSKRLEANKSSDIIYPSYDLDMVDNIGHRSRVLMSVSENKTDEESHTKHERHFNTESSNQSDSDNIVPIALILAANTPNKSKENDTNVKENMTIVKRSIDDSKLVFWNDLYDDNEYGIKVDYADKIREKHLANNRGVIQKSKDWIQGKINNITGKVKDTMKKKTVTCKKTTPKSKLDSSKPKMRKIRNSNENPDISMKRSFATLNANMKKVCQQAAKAVQTRDDKDGAAATSLMQQLVRLMTDLVDIQIQQKTCAKLPSDLQNFLDWLTAPAENNVHVDDLTPAFPDYVAVDDGFARFDKSTKSNFLTTFSMSEDSHQDDRTECLGTIRAVQDLILQYEGMNDDDKSKMSGVKEYLENQLNFLNKKINSSKLYEKRELPRKKRNSYEKPKKFIKNFSKKHTRTTFSDYVTENHEDNIVLNKNHVKDNYNNLNSDLGVKITNEKLTRDEIKMS